MNIVILDAQTVTRGDISFGAFKSLGNLTVYPLTEYSQIASRVADADAVICNKTVLNRDTLRLAKRLKYIGLFATGYNNIDTVYCREADITVCNAGSYSSDAVAQHTFAFILELVNKVGKYNDFVQNGGWLQSDTFSPFVFPLNELSGKTLGIVGGGNIGTAVSKIGAAFNMRVLINSRTKREFQYGSFAPLDTLLSESDIVTVHCPLNSGSQGMFSKTAFEKMKRTALFINTARGGVVVERDLVWALESGQIAGAAIDVLENEPMRPDCPLLGVKNCIITPHIAWAPIETRGRLFNIVYENLRLFLLGTPQNVVS